MKRESILSPSLFRFSTTPFYSPFDFLLLLYFSTTCAELLNVQLVIFKIKLNFLIGTFLFLILLLSKRIIFYKRYFTAFLILLSSISVSSINCSNKIASGGFWLFFVFTYLVYFVAALSLMKFHFHTVTKLYTQSFVFLGCFCLAQVVFSFVHIELPFITQKIGPFARGQAWAYEPSYFALYMTPFITYQNARSFLMPEMRDRLLPLYNVMFLSTTSTGCFFTYLWMLVVLAYFLRKTNAKKWKSIILRSSLIFFTLFGAVGCVFPMGFKMIFKFFIGGFFKHGSFGVRIVGIERSWSAFLDHPFIGVGMGGIPAHTAAKYYGLKADSLDPDIYYAFQGMNVTTEMLASLGLFGVFGFLFLFSLLYKDFKKTFRIPQLTKEEMVTIQSLAISLIVTALTYQFSQSIMRSYIWVHVAICVGYLMRLQSKYLPAALLRK